MPLDCAVPDIDIDADFWSLRFVDEASDSYLVRKNVALPLTTSLDSGAMASVYADGGYGYAATSDTSPAGLRDAVARARQWASATARHAIADSRALPRPVPRGSYASPAGSGAPLSRRNWFDLLLAESHATGNDPRIVDWEVGVDIVRSTQRLITSGGGDVIQHYRFLMPSASVTAHANGDTVVRT
ncbi:MAG: DNA gyrase modulator, partial [Casimicrobiaceae bacterium]